MNTEKPLVRLPCGCRMEWSGYYETYTINGGHCNGTCERRQHLTWKELKERVR